MASTVKTAISIQEGLFERVNQLAESLQISRSRLFAMAVEDFIKKNENRVMLSRIDKAFADYPDPNEQSVCTSMQKKQVKNLERDLW